MSLESSVGALLASTSQLLAWGQQLGALTAAKVTEIGDAYVARVATYTTSRFVDPVNGSDANSGLTAASPLRSVQVAINAAPIGGIANVVLTAPLAIAGASISILQRQVRLSSSSGIKHAITFERVSDGTNRSLRGFRLAGQAGLIIDGLRLVVPMLDGTFTGLAAGGNEVLVGDGGPDGQMLNFGLVNSEIDIPAAPFGAVLVNGVPWRVYIRGLTATGLAINGRFHRGYTNTAGTPTTATPDILTNLSSV